MSEKIKMMLHIAKPELKVSWGGFIGLFLFYTLYAVLFVMWLDSIEANVAIIDILFMMLFVFGPTWFKTKGVQYQKLQGNTWGSPSIINNLHLPLKRETIVWKTIFIYLLSSVPFQLYLFIMLYVFSPDLRGLFEPSAYISFMIIWLSFGIYIGFGALTLEATVTNLNYSILTSVLSISLLILAIVLILAFPYLFTYGIVEWTIIMANKWSFASVCISIVLAVIGIFYWSSRMVKQLNKVDYL